MLVVAEKFPRPDLEHFESEDCRPIDCKYIGTVRKTMNIQNNGEPLSILAATPLIKRWPLILLAHHRLAHVT